jgi:hypothetical protein
LKQRNVEPHRPLLRRLETSETAEFLNSPQMHLHAVECML